MSEKYCPKHKSIEPKCIDCITKYIATERDAFGKRETELMSKVNSLEERNRELRKTIVRCAIPLEALKIVPDGLGDEVRAAIEDAVDSIRKSLTQST